MGCKITNKIGETILYLIFLVFFAKNIWISHKNIVPLHPKSVFNLFFIGLLAQLVRATDS